MNGGYGFALTVSEGCPWCGLEACNVLWVGSTDDGGVTWCVDFGEDVNPALCDVCRCGVVLCFWDKNVPRRRR